jgi:PiT family inorganic phosphate transporter
VLIASALGLPVSSTHIAIGGVFGVGFLREQLANLGLKADGPKPPKPVPNEPSSLSKTPEDAVRKQIKREKRRLVRRRHVFGIAAAWVVTVPAAGFLAGILYAAMKAVSDF